MREASNGLSLLATPPSRSKPMPGSLSLDDAGHWREIFDALPAAVYVTDAQGKIVYFNPACVEFSGRTPTPGSDHWCVTWKLFHPDGRPMPHDECPMAVSLRKGKAIRGAEAIAERPDGTRIWFEPYPTPLFDEEGRLTGGINMLVDITGRKQSELLLKSEKQALERLASGEALDEVLEFLIGTVEEQSAGRLVGSIALLNESQDTFVGSLGPRLPESYHDAVRGMLVSSQTGSCCRAVLTRKAVIIRDVTRDPAWSRFAEFIVPMGYRSAWSTVISSSGGQLLGTFAMYGRFPQEPTEADVRFVDGITRVAALAIERKAAESALQASQGRFRQTLSLMPAAVYSCDVSGLITFFNERAAELWGRAPRVGDLDERFCGSEQMILPDGTTLPHEKCPMAVALREGKSFRDQQVGIRRPDGSVVTVLVNIDPIRDEAGRVIGAINAFHDVTAIKQAEEALGLREMMMAGQRAALELAINDAPLESSLRAIVDTAVEALGGGVRAAVYLSNPEKTALHHVVGMCQEYAQAVDGFPIGPDSLSCGLATHTGKPVLTADVQEEPLWKPWLWLAERTGFRGCWSFPIHTSRKRYVGTLAIYSSQPRQARQRDIEICSLLTHAASVIISRHTELETRKQAEKALRESAGLNALLSQTATRLLEDSDPQRVVEDCCRGVLQYLDCQAFFNYLLDAESGRLRLNAYAGIPAEEAGRIEWLDFGQAVCGCVARDCHRVVAHEIATTPDARTELVKSYGIQAYCCHPLMVQGRLIGTLSFGTRSRSRFAAQELDAMKAVTDLVALGMNRIQIEQSLRQSQEQFRRSAQTFAALVEQSPLGIYTVDADFRIRHVSEGAMPAFRSVQPVIGRDFAEVMRTIWPEPFATEAIDIFRRTLETGEPYVSPGLTEKRKDIGAIESYEWQVNRVVLADGRFGVVCYFFDTTRLQQALRDFQDSEERFRTMVENIPQLAWMARPDGHIYWYNRRWYEFTGTTPQSQEGWGWKSVHHPDHLEPVIVKWSAALHSGQPWEDTFPLRGRDGRYRWFLSRAYPIRDEQGNVVRWFGTNTDITEHLEIEDRLRQATTEAEQANRAKDRFIAVLSHELRTPLSPVLMTVAAMELDPELPPPFRDDVAMIRRNVEMESRLIDDLLDLSRIISGKLRLNFSSVNLSALVRQVCDTFASDLREKGLRLDCHLDPDIEPIRADAARLQQVLWNLLSNAAKFTPAGGQIRVQTSTQGQRVRLEVSDTGIGIESQMLGRIFDAFEQAEQRPGRQFGGLGLGLAIARSLVTMHDGSISAFSDGRGAGSRFVVELPALSHDESAGSEAQAHVVAGDAKLRILVVEDHAETALVLRKLLSKAGHHVMAVSTVAKALELAANHAFDVLVSDIGLPDGSGYDLMRQLQEVQPIPGIALSGYGMNEDIRKSRDAGFADHIVKPITLEQLQMALGRLRACVN